MDEQRPLMRASHIKQNICSLDNLGEELAGQIKKELNPAFLEQIEEATKLDWLPLEVDIEITEAVFRHLGAKGVHLWAKDALYASTQSTFLGPIVTGALNLFGFNPFKLFNMIPKIYLTIYKNCGEVSLTQLSSKRLRLSFGPIPSMMLKSEAYLMSIAGAVETIFPILKTTGTVRWESDPFGTEHAYFLANW